jgi:uncharacterized coiled-coil protein SlyX
MVVGDEALYLALAEHFPAHRYRLIFAEALSDAEARWAEGDAKLLVLCGSVASAPTAAVLLGHARGAGTKIIAVVNAGELAPALTAYVDKQLPAANVGAVLAAAREVLEERRALPRAAVNVAVTVGSFGRLSASVISPCSLFIPSETPIDEGVMTQLAVDTGDKQLRGWARVVRVGPGESGERGFVVEVQSKEHQLRDYLGGLVRGALLVGHAREQSSAAEPNAGAQVLARRLQSEVGELRNTLHAQMVYTDSLRERLDAVQEAGVFGPKKWDAVGAALSRKFAAQGEMIKAVAQRVDALAKEESAREPSSDIGAGQARELVDIEELRRAVALHQEMMVRLEEQRTLIDSLAARVETLLAQQPPSTGGSDAGLASHVAQQGARIDHLTAVIEALTQRLDRSSSEQPIAPPNAPQPIAPQPTGPLRLPDAPRAETPPNAPQPIAAQPTGPFRVPDAPVAETPPIAPQSTGPFRVSDAPRAETPPNAPQPIAAQPTGPFRLPDAPRAETPPNAPQPIAAQPTGPFRLPDAPVSETPAAQFSDSTETDAPAGDQRPHEDCITAEMAAPNFDFEDDTATELPETTGELESLEVGQWVSIPDVDVEVAPQDGAIWTRPDRPQPQTPPQDDAAALVAASVSPRPAPPKGTRSAGRVWLIASVLLVALAGGSAAVWIFALSPSQTQKERERDGASETNARAPATVGRVSAGAAQHDASTARDISRAGRKPRVVQNQNDTPSEGGATQRGIDGRPNPAPGQADPKANKTDPATDGSPKAGRARRLKNLGYAARLLNKNQTKSARRLLRKLLAQRDDHRVRWLLARSYQREGQHETAIRHLKSAAFRCPRALRPRRLTQLATLYLKVGERDKACRVIKRALRIKPGYRPARKSKRRACARR